MNALVKNFIMESVDNTTDTASGTTEEAIEEKKKISSDDVNEKISLLRNRYAIK